MHATVCTCTLGRLRYVYDFLAELRQRPPGDDLFDIVTPRRTRLVVCRWRLGDALRFIPVALNWAPIASSHRPGG
jgi:hypothetical protein